MASVPGEWQLRTREGEVLAQAPTLKEAMGRAEGKDTQGAYVHHVPGSFDCEEFNARQPSEGYAVRVHAYEEVHGFHGYTVSLVLDGEPYLNIDKPSASTVDENIGAAQELADRLNAAG